MQEAVKIIDDMHISEQKIDVQGELYEYLLKQLKTAGKNGQFLTPRHIIRMNVKLVMPVSGKLQRFLIIHEHNITWLEFTTKKMLDTLVQRLGQHRRLR